VILTTLRGVGTREGRSDKSVNSEFIEGLNYVRNNPVVILILLSTLVNGLLGRSFIELLPAVSGRLLVGGASELAWLTAAAGTGAVLGGLLMSRQVAHVIGLYRLILVALLGATLLLATLNWLDALTKPRCCGGPYYLYDDNRRYRMSGTDPASYRPELPRTRHESVVDDNDGISCTGGRYQWRTRRVGRVRYDLCCSVSAGGGSGTGALRAPTGCLRFRARGDRDNK
jgi:hypothetical protein